MDPKNRFHTAATFRWVRVEHCIVVAVLALLVYLHRHEVRWPHFFLAFVAIDLCGYLPGALAFWRQGRRAAPTPPRIAALYHHLYNLTHSYVTAALVAATWTAVSGRPEWAMLALPIHLSGDRGLFGNTYKPVELPFEPVAVPWSAQPQEAACTPRR